MCWDACFEALCGIGFERNERSRSIKRISFSLARGHGKRWRFTNFCIMSCFFHDKVTKVHVGGIKKAGQGLGYDPPAHGFLFSMKGEREERPRAASGIETNVRFSYGR